MLAVLAVVQPQGVTVGRWQQLPQILDRQPVGAAAADGDPATLPSAAPAAHASAPGLSEIIRLTVRRSAPIFPATHYNTTVFGLCSRPGAPCPGKPPFLPNKA